MLESKSRFSDSCPSANAFSGQLEEYISKFLYSQTGLPQCLSYTLGLVVEEVFNFSLQRILPFPSCVRLPSHFLHVHWHICLFLTITDSLLSSQRGTKGQVVVQK